MSLNARGAILSRADTTTSHNAAETKKHHDRLWCFSLLGPFVFNDSANRLMLFLRMNLWSLCGAQDAMVIGTVVLLWVRDHDLARTLQRR
ncbi:hypothetical protein J2X56_004376 [Herbaspirillum sp. 1173]|uniref:hypothetical protein n=1 Tax=Herbaspirillum sp. 1173 TaxID=2817734 RepID=UPI001066B17C|nr:hypothetical protein [Herbaspirillum sp. 1173]MDR6742348.1 hypothetical protein [Herbaspirillum sp. 1173]